jgi:hypothetical protein
MGSARIALIARMKTKEITIVKVTLASNRGNVPVGPVSGQSRVADLFQDLRCSVNFQTNCPSNRVGQEMYGIGSKIATGNHVKESQGSDAGACQGEGITAMWRQVY